MKAQLLDLIRRANPSCRSAMSTVSESLDRPLSRFERLAIAAHMGHCPACSRARRQFALLVDGLRRVSGPRENRPLPGLPPEARERIKRALREC
ncbi:zf-HC2 domain-containing protein [Tundrisphaera lichenicola]|uniref:zf-HC2 domain-containing protein n=1 Tax=Tundrisphaera lichenicola TaxID=2029860 RepID=UPI003EBFFE8B